MEYKKTSGLTYWDFDKKISAVETQEQTNEKKLATKRKNDRKRKQLENQQRTQKERDEIKVRQRIKRLELSQKRKKEKMEPVQTDTDSPPVHVDTTTTTHVYDGTDTITAAAEAEAVSSRLNNLQIGTHIEIYWKKMRRWYKATITNLDECDGNRFYVIYEDDDTDGWYNLAEEIFRIITEPLVNKETTRSVGRNKAVTLLCIPERCTTCNKRYTDERVLEVANKSYISDFFAYTGICHTCRNDLIVAAKVVNRSSNYSSVIKQLYTLPPIKYTEKTINVQQLFTKTKLLSIMKIPPLCIEKYFNIRVVECKPIDVPDTIGAYFHGDMNELAMKTNHRVLKIEDDSDATLLIINNENKETENDFVILSKMNIDPKSICDFSKSMMMYADSTSTRHGAASGFMFSDDECESRSKVAKHETALLVATPTSTAATMVYNNEHSSRNNNNKNELGTIKTMGAYRNLKCMLRLNKKEKFELIKNNLAYRNLLIEEGMERIKIILVLSKLDVIKNTIINDLKSKISNIQDTSMLKEILLLGHALYEAYVIVYMCGTGEMMNFSALPAHRDGNCSHNVETLTYTGRVPLVQDKERTADQITHSMGKAHILLCDVAVIVECDVPNNIMHCCLKNTTHAADESRNYLNFSRVSGA